jgi:hypothetical protein
VFLWIEGKLIGEKFLENGELTGENSEKFDIVGRFPYKNKLGWNGSPGIYTT